MSQALDALLSLTAADALGAATEFKSPATIRSTYGLIDSYQPGSVFGFAPGEATDDSQMTVATLIGYGRAEGSLRDVLDALLRWVDTSPPDVGGLTRSALSHRSLDGGLRAWHHSGRSSAGNGGLMRVAAVWLAGFEDTELLRQAVLVTALTHADPRCLLASIFFVAFLEELARRTPYELAAQAAWDRACGFDTVGTLERLWNVLDARYLTALDEAREQVGARVRSGVSGVVVSQSGFVLDTLEAALAHGRREDWLASVQPAVMLGDDSDTVACIVGAIAGARGLKTPDHLLPDLRLGHTWHDWSKDWRCVNAYPDVLDRARR